MIRYICDKCKKRVEDEKSLHVEWLAGKSYDVCEDCLKEVQDVRKKAKATAMTEEQKFADTFKKL